MAGADLVVHTAGPFQGESRPLVLEAACKAGVPYVDVCDEIEQAKAGKRLHTEVAAVTAAGIWPGCSALMAAEAIDVLRAASPRGTAGSETLELSFFTAGTGNAGATIVSATFLLLCQKVTHVNRLREAWCPTRLRSAPDGDCSITSSVATCDRPSLMSVVPQSARSHGPRKRIRISVRWWRLHTIGFADACSRIYVTLSTPQALALVPEPLGFSIIQTYTRALLRSAARTFPVAFPLPPQFGES